MKSESISLRRALVLLGIVALGAGSAAAQQPVGGASFAGRLSVDHDWYAGSSTSGSPFVSRRPSSLLRLRFDPTITIGEDVSLPFSFTLTIPETTTQPRATDPGFLDVLRNPSNAFSATPRLGPLRLSLGTQSPQLSSLSAGDVQLFGIGGELSVGGLRIATAAGTVGRRASADTVSLLRGAYARTAYMGRLAYVSGASEVGLNVVRVGDDPSSLSPLASMSETMSRRLIPMPEESLTATLNTAIEITTGASVRAEFGASMFTRDMNAGAVDGPLEALMHQRMSTRADIAGGVGVELSGEAWGVTVGSTYVGAGYRALALPWLEADRLDLTISPHASLLDDDLTIAGTFGWRRNNVGATETATTSQPLASLTADARIGEALSLNARYSNYGVRTPLRNDTLRVETVAQSISLSPTITLASDAVTHTLSAAASLDDYTDYNPISGADATNRTRSVTGTYAAALSALPLSVDLGGSWLVNELAVGELSIASASIGASATLGDDAVTLGARATLTRSVLDAGSPDEGVTLRLNGTWRIVDGLRLRVDASTTGYDYATRASMRESLLRTSLQYRW
jgi:hypothetical protein